MAWILIASGVLAAGAAGAATKDDVPSLTVRYNKEALNTDIGVRSLYRRLVAAANVVCPGLPSGSHIVSNAVLQCRKESIARAVQAINNPRLAALYETSANRG